MVFQSREHVHVGPAHHGTLGNQSQNRSETDRVELTRENIGEHNDGDRWNIAGPLCDHRWTVEKAEAQDVGEVVVGVHDNIAPLINGDGHRHPKQPDDINDHAAEESQRIDPNPVPEVADPFDEVTEGDDVQNVGNEPTSIEVTEK